MQIKGWITRASNVFIFCWNLLIFQDQLSRFRLVMSHTNVIDLKKKKLALLLICHELHVKDCYSIEPPVADVLIVQPDVWNAIVKISTDAWIRIRLFSRWRSFIHDEEKTVKNNKSRQRSDTNRPYRVNRVDETKKIVNKWSCHVANYFSFIAGMECGKRIESGFESPACSLWRNFMLGTLGTRAIQFNQFRM